MSEELVLVNLCFVLCALFLVLEKRGFAFGAVDRLTDASKYKAQSSKLKFGAGS